MNNQMTILETNKFLVRRFYTEDIMSGLTHHHE